MRPILGERSRHRIRHWTEITPEEAAAIRLPHAKVIGPLVAREGLGVCPWPWYFERLRYTLSRKSCPYCGTVGRAGLQHPDRDEHAPNGRPYVSVRKFRGPPLWTVDCLRCSAFGLHYTIRSAHESIAQHVRDERAKRGEPL